MIKIVVYGALDKGGYQELDKAGVHYASVPAFDLDNLHRELADADGVVLRYHPFPRETILKAPRLKIISRVGVGCDNVHIETARERGVDVAITGDVSSRAVAEQALALMLGAAKQMIRYDEAIRDGDWQLRESIDAIELDNKSMLLVGFGRIGRRTGELCNAFGMKVHAYDPFVDPLGMGKAGVIPVNSLEEGVALADFISLHIPGGKDNDGIIDERLISKMKPQAVIVNTSRGTLFNEKALSEAVSKGQIFGAGTDVFSREPVTADNPLVNNKRIVLSPHSSAMTKECMRRLCVAAVDNAIDYLKGDRDKVLLFNG